MAQILEKEESRLNTVKNKGESWKKGIDQNSQVETTWSKTKLH